MNYNETINFLFSSLPMYQRTGAAAYKNSLEATIALDKAHSHPHRNFKTLHIAGTNGKGSVSHILAAILERSGYKTGLYTSPHLVDFRERIRINGNMIPEAYVTQYVNTNQNLIKNLQPSFFEMTADLAFQYFSDEKVDFAVIETGMGGRLDSTNIISPVISIITNIGLDHTRFLGNTVQEIAGEKGGIIKQNTPVIIGEYDKTTADVFKIFSKEKSAEIKFADRIYSCHYSLMGLDRKISHHISSEKHNFPDLITDLHGEYQVKNIITVLAAIEELQQKDISIPQEAIYEGISNVGKLTGLRGRWEEIGYNPLTVCDTGHNESGIKDVVSQIRNTAYKQLHIVWGMVSDKDFHSILKLLPTEAMYYFTRAALPRSLDEKELKKVANKIALKGDSYSSVSKAFEAAKTNAEPEDLVFIGGSSFVVGEVLGV